MELTLIAIVFALAAPPGSASSYPSVVLKTPNLAKNAEAFPTLVGSTKAIARINRALRAADAKELGDMKKLDCLVHSPERGYWWEQSVDTTLVGAHFASFYRHGDSSCGGAHPDFIFEAFVFDLSTGEEVNWATLLPDNLLGKSGAATRGTPLSPNEVLSPALTALFVAQSEEESPPECKEEFARQHMSFQLWPDAKGKGLVMHTFSLPQAVEGVCGGPVTIPVATLKHLRVSPALIRDIETGRHEVHETPR